MTKVNKINKSLLNIDNMFFLKMQGADLGQNIGKLLQDAY